MSGAYIQSLALMGTVVTFHVVGHESKKDETDRREEAVARAVEWFERVERACSRFDPSSEISRLSSHAGTPVEVSPLVFEAVRFALAVAEESQGAFDPTVGLTMEGLGFDREYRTGKTVRSFAAIAGGDGRRATYRDVLLDAEASSITLARPLQLDLGAVAKGLAVDLAAKELEPLDNFAIDAGGDLYLGGSNAGGKPWTVGVRHPRNEGAFIDTLTVTNAAVCTSGDYERRTPDDEGHHIVDPARGSASSAAAAVTVLSSSAMVADALGTAAFVLGPERGIALLEKHGVDGFIVTPTIERFDTKGMRREYSLARTARRVS